MNYRICFCFPVRRISMISLKDRLSFVSMHRRVGLARTKGTGRDSWTQQSRRPCPVLPKKQQHPHLRRPRSRPQASRVLRVHHSPSHRQSRANPSCRVLLCFRIFSRYVPKYTYLYVPNTCLTISDYCTVVWSSGSKIRSLPSQGMGGNEWREDQKHGGKNCFTR